MQCEFSIRRSLKPKLFNFFSSTVFILLICIGVAFATEGGDVEISSAQWPLMFPGVPYMGGMNYHVQDFDDENEYPIDYSNLLNFNDEFYSIKSQI